MSLPTTQSPRIPIGYVGADLKQPVYIDPAWWRYLVEQRGTADGDFAAIARLPRPYLPDLDTGDEPMMIPGLRGDAGPTGTTGLTGGTMLWPEPDEGEAPPLFPGSASTAPILASGKYTPTLTNTTNLDGSTAFEFLYIRVGPIVTVSGRVNANPTAAGLVELGISLPIASNLGAAEDCAGVAFSPEVAGQGASIRGNTSGDRAQMEWIAVDTANRPMYCIFQYEII